MRASLKAFKALQFFLFIFLVVYTVHSYQQLKVLADRAVMTDPFGNTFPGPGYEEFLAYKAKTMTVILLLLGGIFVLEPRFHMALTWLRTKPHLDDHISIARFAAGALVAIFLILYIGLTAKYLLVVRGLGL